MDTFFNVNISIFMNIKAEYHFKLLLN